MVAIVRDEADLIREWIEVHAASGVDVFVVTDHRSVDGTREILSELTRHHEIEVIRRGGPLVEQARWMTEMALRARRRHGVDWVVLADADEFWLPRQGSLRRLAESAPAPVLLCERSNMLPDRAAVEAPGYRFFHNLWRVARPFPDHPPRPDLDQELDWPLFLRRMPPKVLCAVAGLQEVLAGNHDVVHEAAARAPAAAEILHYPVRGWVDFERQTAGHGEAIALDPSTPRDQGWHVRRLHETWQRGELRRFYDLLLDDVEAHRRGSEPRLVPDLRLWRAISPATVPSSPGRPGGVPTTER